MAEMSQDEKRAAGWKKLKKYQQHKTVSSTSRTTKKKHESSNQNEEESLNLFTGFSEFPKNGVELHSDEPTPTMQATEEQNMSTSCSFSNKKMSEESSVVGKKRSSVDLLNAGSVENDSIATPTEICLMPDTIPVAANIFSNTYSSGANNFSDFFDTLKSSADQSIENASSYVKTNRPADMIDEHSKLESPSLEVMNEVPRMEAIEQRNSNSGNINHSSIDVSNSAEANAEIEGNAITYKVANQMNTVVAQSVLPSNLASSAESLRQLSLELSGLIDESVSTSGPSSTEMERRNQELAALLASEQQKSERLLLQMREYESRVTQLQVDASQHQTEQLARLQRELSAIQEQLQLHVQTVGILVGEKAELEAALNKSQQTAKQKATEVEELQGRLKASRHRVSDLERELSVSTSGSKQCENSLQQQSKELSCVKLEKEMLAKQVEENEEEIAELRQNLDMRSGEVQSLQQQLQEKQSQLDLAQLRVQQLSLSETTEIERQLESLHQQKVGLERQVLELQKTVQALGSERDQANTQYQEYLHHVNGHLKSMADKLAVATAENEQLSNREQSLVKHLSELEKQLQQQQNQRNRFKDSPSHSINTEHIQQLEEKIQKLEEEKEKFTVESEKLLQENRVIQDKLEMYVSKVEELENTVEGLRADQPDTKKLLAAMESDKVAASLAVAQNQKLKEHLEELQEGFIQMSNNKLELTEELQREQHLSKELGDRLAQQELEISELRLKLAENEEVLENMQKSSSEQLSRQILKEDHIADQMQHYKAQGYMNEALQSELQEIKELCDSLRTENDELRMKLANCNVLKATESEEIVGDNTVDRLKADVFQLTLEKDQLLSQLQQVKFQTTTTYSPSECLLNQDIDINEYCNLKEAMEKLQSRFTKTMEEIAELSDEKQRLEHLVLQLQGETETIGEYIALYQMQRSVLRQRAQEKDEQLARLARDREEVKIKLNELNRLIAQLVAENGKNPSANISQPLSNVKNATEAEMPLTEGLTNGDVSITQQVSNEGEEWGDNTIQTETAAIKTADKIIALLSEIETSTLVEPKNIESFHPCPWCSGRLITV